MNNQIKHYFEPHIPFCKAANRRQTYGGYVMNYSLFSHYSYKTIALIMITMITIILADI